MTNRQFRQPVWQGSAAGGSGGGSALLAGAPANYPTLLNGLAARPAWQVAGVDYFVGCPAATVFQDPQTQGPAGTSYSVVGSIRNLNINANNVVLDGFDFSLHSGIGLFIGGNNCTVQNCRFVNNSYGGSYQVDNAGINTLIQNCTVDGSGAANTGQASLIKHEGAGLLTLFNNWFRNFPQQVLENVLGPADHYSIQYKANLIDEGGLNPVAHLNYMQHANGTCDNCEVQFNTARQVTSVGGEGWQFYMDGAGGGTINNINVHHNTVYGLPQPGAVGGNGVSIASYFHGPNDPLKGPTGGTGKIISNNYVLYFPLVGGFSQSCNFVFYGGSGTGGSFNTFTNSGNIDMFNNKRVLLDNTEI
jgi:hypothetical protein